MAAVSFTAILVLLESLVVGPSLARQPQLASALLWIAVLFAALLAATRSFDRELEDDALDAVIALPGGKDALFAGKTLALALLLGIVALLGTILSIGLLDLAVALPGHLLLVAVLGVAALAPVVVLVVALTVRLRARAILVPVLALPMLVPQLVASTQGSSAALAGDATGSLGWSGLLFAFALVYAVLGLTIVPAAIE
ncbi:MAG: heme exporter protein CcmB [Chloroflexi bacterium]|nr:heme exporter protein CcmB [Chloroflexota bacterium]